MVRPQHSVEKKKAKKKKKLDKSKWNKNVLYY